MNKKTYLVTKEEFNKKVCAIDTFVVRISDYTTSMVIKIDIYAYVPANYYIGGNYVELYANNDKKMIEWCEESFEGRWSE